jgi:signal transduction histidine kinase
VRISVKLSIVFCAAALFLLAVEVAAVMVVGRLNQILTDTIYFNQQMDQVNAALRAIRVSPQRAVDHLARVSDLYKWARTEQEQKLLAAASADLTRTRSLADATAHLDELNAYYLQTTAAAHQRLLQIHQRIVIGIIIIMVGSILLFILFTWMIRSWLLHPVRDLGETLASMAQGKVDQRVYSTVGREFDEIGRSLNVLTVRLRDLETRVADSEKFAQLGEACTHITHNVRSLLRSIRSLAQYESNSGDADQDSRVGFNYIIAAVNKLDTWVRDVHRAVRPMDILLAPHQIEPIIHDGLSLLRPSLSERNLTIDYRASDELPGIVMDRGLFEQAFVAIITNAIEASPDNGRIGVSLQNGADRVTVCIEDEGAGMTEATRVRACKPFFSTKPERTGLGLSVAHSIVKQHGGDIEIDSAPNKGTRVSIHFRVATPAPPASKSESSASTHR